MPPGTPIGYGSTYHTTTPTVIAVVPAGFADGVPRQLADGGRMLICGCYAPVIGCVGMTHLTAGVRQSGASSPVDLMRVWRTRGNWEGCGSPTPESGV
ncbi:alanine racemase C-terminal domain-containing protein [Streptosporangium sp. NPDC002544]|uniref:alanine racemase C-terminal domain-containing protein n=1 Tax=Streptosporangium sp. NPDC002544 TaxID=3154538 RepID=UPI003324FA23